MQVRRMLLVVSLVAGILAATSPIEEAAANHCSTLITKLSGPTINGVVPSGKGDWRGNDLCNLGLEMKIQISNVNLPNGTVVTFESCVDEATGLFPFRRNLTLNKGAAGFQLRRADGDSVPRCDQDTPVRILHAGSTILSGTWCAPVVRKCN